MNFDLDPATRRKLGYQLIDWIDDYFPGRSVIRAMVISYLTEERHLHGLEEALTQAARKYAITSERVSG